MGLSAASPTKVREKLMVGLARLTHPTKLRATRPAVAFRNRPANYRKFIDRLAFCGTMNWWLFHQRIGDH